MKQLVKYFQLNQHYQFDIADITSIIYTVCALGVVCGCNMTVLFCIGSLISTAFCWQAHRLNLVLLNVSLLAMNVYYLFNMIW